MKEEDYWLKAWIFNKTYELGFVDMNIGDVGFIALFVLMTMEILPVSNRDVQQLQLLFLVLYFFLFSTIILLIFKENPTSESLNGILTSWVSMVALNPLGNVGETLCLQCLFYSLV